MTEYDDMMREGIPPEKHHLYVRDPEADVRAAILDEHLARAAVWAVALGALFGIIYKLWYT